MKAKKPLNFQQIALVGRSKLGTHTEFLQELKTFLEAKGSNVSWDSNLSAVYGTEKEQSICEMLKKADLVITLGGDGTVLKAAHDWPKRKDLLLLGVNLGNLGFLTESTTERMQETLEELFADNFHSDERLLLRATLYRQGKKIATHLALNDIVVNQGNFARLINLRAEVNQRKMIEFHADGVIVATPTGSTGHSLSAGGPIVHPQIDTMVFTPICPSTLSVRPILLPSDRHITLTIQTDRRFADNRIGLTIDGQIVLPVEYGDEIRIRRSSRKLRFVRLKPPGGNHFRLLREKLSWGK